MRYDRFSRILTLAIVTVTALALATSADAGLWTPAETTTAVWYDAADDSSVTLSGSDVSQWNDKSGNTRHATQATAANQPDYISAEQNGLNVIRLNGTSEYFDLGTGLDWMAADASHATFAMLKNDNGANLYGAANGGSGDASLHVGWSGANYRVNRWGNDWYTAPVNAIAGDYNLIRWTWLEGGSKSVYANAQEEGTGSSGGGIGSGLSAMAGGGRIGNVVGQGLLDADIGEFLIVAGSPDQTTIDKIEGYLAWKWGQQANLPVGHPYELAAPQGVAVAVPEPSACVLATLGLMGLGWYWRRRRRGPARLRP